MRPLSYIQLIALCALSSFATAQDEPSAWGALLDSVTVRTYRYTSPVKVDAQGTTRWQLEDMALLPQVLGNADPMHYAQMLPGIQTNSEYRSGIYIEGCDNQHNLISVDGVPLYNVSHLFGLFSTFNASHYETLSISKGRTSAAAPNRLGGQLDVGHTLAPQDTLSADLSLGLIASQGTLRLPLSARTTLLLSGRTSYLNWLYGDWLRTDDQQIHYSFYDANATLLHRIDAHNLLMADYYSGRDWSDIAGGGYSVGLNARWGNYMGSLHWWCQHDHSVAHTTAYLTRYDNRTRFRLQGMGGSLSSCITEAGLRNETVWRRWDLGAEVLWRRWDDGTSSVHDATELSAWVDYNAPLSDLWTLIPGLRSSGYASRGSFYGAIDPSLHLRYDDGTLQASANYALRHQYLFQTGCTDAGLPTEYWLSAGPDLRPQYAHEWTLHASSYLWSRRYRLSADLFYRRLSQQLAYRGSILDDISSQRHDDAWFRHGRGQNYGYSLMLNKCSGRLTGWLSYTYTHARRTFTSAGLSHSYPASHERPHELNAVLTYRANRHWDFGASGVWASGTPFTAAQSVYLLDYNIILHYGPYNGARLSPYIRLDLSTNYRWLDRHGHPHCLNFSLYNVASRRNELFYYLRVRDDGTYVYRPVSFVLRVMPSVSYTL